LSYVLLTPKVYSVTNILVLNQMQDGDLINQSEVSATVSVLNKLINQHKNIPLDMFPINRNDFKDIMSINTSEIKGSSALWVEVDTLNRQTGVSVMQALPDYIFSNPNIYRKLMLQKMLLQKNRDDLKVIIDNPLKSLKLSKDTIVYMPSIDLYNLREKYNRLNVILDKIEGRQFITLAWKTVPPENPYKPRASLIILMGLATGFFLGIFSAFLMEWIKNATDAQVPTP